MQRYKKNGNLESEIRIYAFSTLTSPHPLRTRSDCSTVVLRFLSKKGRSDYGATTEGRRNIHPSVAEATAPLSLGR